MLTRVTNIKSISVLWKKLVGNPADFSLANRLFNAVCLIAFFELILFSCFNLIIGVPFVSIAIATVLQAFFYYLARYKKKFYIVSVVNCMLAYIAMAFNFWDNSGIDGPSMLGFVMTIVVFVAITPTQWHKWWLILHIVFGCGLLVLNYYSIGVNYTYHSKQDRFTDNAVTYVILVVCVFFVIRYTLDNYNKERHLAQKHAAAIAQQNVELENLNHEKNKLFSMISHDLRSPLNSIQGYLELLSYGLLNEHEKAKIENELLIHTRQTQDMLANLLSWSRTQLDGANADLQPLNFYKTVSATLDMMMTVATKKGIRLTNAIDPDVLVKADADMLQLVVRNLVHNAIKFTPSDGEISIATYTDGKECLVCIKDNGLGIPDEKQADIFSLKIRSAYGTGKEKGIGLGLFLCRQLVELQDGRIWFTSKSGHGSEFMLALPSAS